MGTNQPIESAAAGTTGTKTSTRERKTILTGREEETNLKAYYPSHSSTFPAQLVTHAKFSHRLRQRERLACRLAGES